MRMRREMGPDPSRGYPSITEGRIGKNQPASCNEGMTSRAHPYLASHQSFPETRRG